MLSAGSMRRDQYGNVSESNAGVCLRVWVSIVSLLQVRSSSATRTMLGSYGSGKGPVQQCCAAQLKHAKRF